ncbi:MAG: FAD-dependent oxidoreductase [Methylococcales bacterium]
MDKKINQHDRAPSSKRRTLLKGLGLAPLLPLLPACQLGAPTEQALDYPNRLSFISPINRMLGNFDQTIFTGDDFTRPHQMLWQKSSYLKRIGGLPKPKRKAELVIIGGGMSGLMTAYLTRTKNPVILEQAPRFGGNAKAEAWQGLHYALGAAYLVKPEPGSVLFKLFKDLGISKDCAIKAGGDGDVVINGRRIENFWAATSEPGYKAVYKKLHDYFMSFIEENGALFPDYPTDDAKLRHYINTLDREDFKSHLEKNIGATLPPHLATLLEHYCYSSFGGSSTELSAAAGINFFAAEFGDIAVFPGGNAYIAEALLKQLHRQLPERHLLPGSLVFDVRMQQNDVLISYLDANHQAQSLLAERVVMACPKFVAAKLIDDLPAEKLAAIKALEYRAYLVANLLVNRPIKETDYDIYWLGPGNADLKQVAAYAQSRGITDIINANFSSPDTQKSVLSFYQAFPYRGGRTELFTENANMDMKSRISAQLKQEIYPFYGLTEHDVAALRLTRWGHPLPLAAVGLLDSGIVDKLRAPLAQRIYFVEQDNWALPAVETVAAEAGYWSSVIQS